MGLFNERSIGSMNSLTTVAVPYIIPFPRPYIFCDHIEKEVIQKQSWQNEKSVKKYFLLYIKY